MAAIAIIQIGFSFGLYRRITGGVWIGKLAIGLAFFPILYLLEALTYYYIRKRRYEHRSAWWHVGIVLLQRVFIYGLLTPLYGNNVAGTGGALILPYISWACIILSHVFFVQVLVSAFKKRPPEIREADSPHLLDEIVDDPTINLE